MWKSQFKGRTEDESFNFIANPMHLRQCAAVILSQHGAKFLEISSMDDEVLLLASYNPDSKDIHKAFVFAYPEDPATNNE